MLGNSASLQQVRRTLEQANTVSHWAAKTDGEVKDASADGSVLLFTPIAPMSVFPHVYEKLGYEPVTDYTPISQVATFDLAVAVGANVPSKSLKELVAWLKKNPSQATYGSPAAGSLPHFFAALFGRAAMLISVMSLTRATRRPSQTWLVVTCQSSSLPPKI
jgi:tripartite-type tricarboxylate transporter receptor subunit TctC